MSGRAMSSADAAWLHMDRPTNRLVVTSVMWLDGPIDRAQFEALIRERLIDRFPRFSQRVVDRTTSVRWEDDPQFDARRHLRYGTLDAPGGPVELQRYVSRVASTPLDRSRPLWEIHLVDGYAGGGSAVVSRIHHCIADGVALARVLMSLTDDPLEAEAARVAAPGGRGWGLPGTVGYWTGRFVRESRDPLGVLRRAGGAGRSLARLAVLSPDPRTSLRGRLGTAKSVVWSDAQPLEALLDAAHRHGVTLNDLILSALAGALRSHLARTDGYAPDVRAVVPVNLRPLDKPLPAELGNAFGLLYVDLPLSVDDPLARVAAVRRRTKAVKNSADPVVSFRLLDFIGHLPYELEQLFVSVFTSKASLVITNVPGPPRPVHLAGRRVCGTIGWPPESGALGLGISIISYDGNVIIGALTDDRLTDDPARIVSETCSQLDRLVRAAPAAAEQAADLIRRDRAGTVGTRPS